MPVTLSPNGITMRSVLVYPTGLDCAQFLRSGQTETATRMSLKDEAEGLAAAFVVTLREKK